MRIRPAVWLFALLFAMSVLVAACGDDDDDGGGGSASTSKSTTTAASSGAEASKCGDGSGKKATGEPIKVGGIATKQPGTDFTDIPNMVKAYMDCVNDNGGIKGRPVEYILETEQTDPAQIASLAKKLIESEKVVAIVGNTSLIECDVNHKYYESKGFYMVGSGIAPTCYSTPNIAAANMGPRYSSDGAAQYAIKDGAKKLAFAQSKVPGTGYNVGGVELIAKDANIPLEKFEENVPIQDANSIAIKLAQAAGSDGAVVLNFTPPEALKILQAAQRQGLQNRVKSWNCSTPCNTDFLADALGSAWDDKLFVNAELNLTSADGPDSQLYRDVLSKYGKKVAGGLGSFSQMGFVEGRILEDALNRVEGEFTAEAVNEAIKNTKDLKTDILCKPWYFGDAPLHIPNNVDRTVTPQGGKMVEKAGCEPISDVDPDIKKVRDIEAQQ